MRQQFVPLVFLLFSISWAVVSAQDCPALVQNALTRAQEACAMMRSNQACYGYRTLDAQLQSGLSPFAFNGVGDITPVDTIESLHMSALNPATDEWGVTMMRVRADISPDHPKENVTLLAFGEVSINPENSEDYQPMQAFALKTGDAESGCTDITENGLIIQTPEGVGRVTLWINDVRVRIGSTVLFEAQPGGDLVVSTFEGHAEVQAMGGTQEATTGMRVRVPMDADMHPSAPPTLPEPFDAASSSISLTSLLAVTTSFTDGTVTSLVASDGGNGVGGGSGNGIGNRPECSQGQGQTSASCADLANANANNGAGSANGNPGGNGNGNGNQGGGGGRP